MSYILDALRKSEQERQISAGLSVGLLYPIEHKPKRNIWPILTLLGLVVMAAFVFAWWTARPTTLIPEISTKISTATNKPAIPGIPHPQTISQNTFPEPIAVPEKILPEPEKIILPKKPVPEHAHRKTPVPPRVARQKSPPQAEALASASAVSNNAATVDPLKDLPPLVISGYIHNEQNGNLAIINNQLVHEGEELLPGLLLVKILENSAIFSYRGYVFSR
ncbi:MAG: general secretion pathway protein GspB [Gallionella sp.]|jgi:general secretion pathway protein B